MWDSVGTDTCTSHTVVAGREGGQISCVGQRKSGNCGQNFVTAA